METKEILGFCLEKGLLLDKDLLEMFSESDFETSKLIIEKIGQCTQKRILTRSIFNEEKERVNQAISMLPEENQKRIEKLIIKLGLSISISKEVSIEKKDIQHTFEEGEVKIVSMNPTLSRKIEVKDFVKYFRSRFMEMKGILQEHSELNNLISIDKISGNRQGFSLIGIVFNKRTTKNQNVLLEIEDLTGKITALINKNNEELLKKVDGLALDSIIGLKCSGSREIVFVNDIIFPEALLFERKKSTQEEYAVFTGDLHVGSDKFLEESFLKFIDYLNGNTDSKESEKIKYLFIVGDLIAGVGIHPEQEKELKILDVEGQYNKAAELLGKIRKDIKIIISPGNHDALRIMEPQPLLDEKYAWALYDLKNVILTNNPSLVNIGSRKGFSGFDVLTYHGYSFHYYCNNISPLIKEKAIHAPEKVMAFLLKNRHLAPTHSSTLYFPSENDPLLINKIPDIFVSAHTHKSAVAYYNNILTISSSSWESKTAYQEKMGNEPDFCKVPLFNLKTRAIKILDFE
ncbi:MAG: metallophosphoesterase [archaeon]|nr:metallophosphoesterase [archaeon]